MKIKDTKSNKIFMLIVVIIFAILLSEKSCSSRKETNFTADIEKSLYVESISADINLWIDENLDSIKVIYNTDEDGYLEVNEKNNTTSIVEKVESHFFKIDFENEEPTISIYLPSTYYNDIEIKTISGDVETYNNLKLPKLSIKATSGDISLMDTKIDNNISIETISGTIESQNITSDKINLDFKSGNFESYYLEANDIDISGISGNINIDTIDANTFNLKSTSSDIDIFNANIRKRASINTVSGDLDLIANETSDKYQFKIKTISGDIKINDENHEGSLTIGEGLPFDINTVSGRIDLHTK